MYIYVYLYIFKMQSAKLIGKIIEINSWKTWLGDREMF